VDDARLADRACAVSLAVEQPGGSVRSVTVTTDKITLKGGGAASATRSTKRRRVHCDPVRLGGVVWCARAAAKQSGNPPSTVQNDRVDRFVGQPKTAPPASCSQSVSSGPHAGRGEP
jgi:hypothetical protein